MFLPLGTDRPLRRPTQVTYVLLGLNVGIHLAMAVLQQAKPDMHRQILEVMWIDGNNFRVWGLLTSAFLHGGLFHLLGNSLFLWVFGPNVEDRLGRLGFIALYLAGAAASSGLHALFENAPAIGASGAIAAVSGSYLVLFPRTKVRVLLFFILIGVFWIPAWWFIGASIFWDLIAQGMASKNGIANLAHLGGYAFGATVSVILLATRVVPREPYDLFTIGRQAYRRRQLREAASQTERKQKEHWTPNRRSDAESEKAAEARAEVARHLAQNELEPAAEAYKSLIEQYADDHSIVTLSRRQQYDLANHFFARRDFETAAFAYERFQEAYPLDSESPRVRLMLGVINARYLNDPVRAKQVLADLPQKLHQEDDRSLAEELMRDLG